MKKLSLLAIMLGLICLPLEAFGQMVASDELIDATQAIYEQDANDPIIASQHAERSSLHEKIRTAARSLKSPFTRALHLMKSSTITGSIKETLEIDGLKIGFRNKIKVEHAYIANYYRRYDEYEIPVELAPFSAPKDSINFGISLKANSRMGLWRIYDTFGQAMCPRAGKSGQELIKASDATDCLLDYVGDYMPHSADNILKMLKPGEMVKLQAPLTLKAGFDYLTDLTTKIALDAGVSKVYYGAFDIYVFRADNDKVRLRLIGQNSDKWSAHLDVNLIKSAFSTVLKILIQSAKGADIIKYDFQKGKEHVFLADYTLDFKQKAVRDAYDELFAKAKIYKDPQMLEMLRKMVDPRKADDPNRHEDIRNMLVSNLEAIENIYRDQVLANVPEEDRWIDRNFVGSNEIDVKTSHSLVLGLPFIFRTEYESATTENHMVKSDIVEKNGNIVEERDHYVFPTFTSRFRNKSKTFDHDEQLFKSASIIFKSNDKFQPTSFESMNFIYEQKDNKYKPKEHSLLLEHFRQVLPEWAFSEILNELRKHSLDLLSEKIKKARAVVRYFINPNALKIVENSFSRIKVEDRPVEIAKSIAKHLLAIGHRQNSGDFVGRGNERICTQAGFKMGQNANSKYNGLTRDDITLRFSCNAIADIAKALATAVTRNEFDLNNSDPKIRAREEQKALAEAEARKNAIATLSSNGLFKKIGPAFIFGLLPNVDFKEVARFEMLFYLPHQEEPVSVGIGSVESTELFEQINDQQRMHVDEIPDLRLEGTKDTLTERNTKRRGA